MDTDVLIMIFTIIQLVLSIPSFVIGIFTLFRKRNGRPQKNFFLHRHKNLFVALVLTILTFINLIYLNNESIGNKVFAIFINAASILIMIKIYKIEKSIRRIDEKHSEIDAIRREIEEDLKTKDYIT